MNSGRQPSCLSSSLGFPIARASGCEVRLRVRVRVIGLGVGFGLGEGEGHEE